MYIDDDFNKVKMIIVLAIIACVFCLLFSGCKSFKAQISEGATEECKDFYYVMEYYSVQGGDSAFVGTVYSNCQKSRERKKDLKIEELCGKLYSDKDEYMKCVK